MNKTQKQLIHSTEHVKTYVKTNKRGQKYIINYSATGYDIFDNIQSAIRAALNLNEFIKRMVIVDKRETYGIGI